MCMVVVGDSPKRESRSPRRQARGSRRSRSRSPVQSSSHEKLDREKWKDLQKQKDKERLMKDDEEYEERNRQRKIKERETVYKKVGLTYCTEWPTS